MTSPRGRPLRFLAMVTVGWVGMRVMLLWPAGLPPERWVAIVLPPAMAKRGSMAMPERATPGGQIVADRAIRRVPPRRHDPLPAMPVPIAGGPAGGVADRGRVRLALVTPVGVGAGVGSSGPVPLLVPPGPTAAGSTVTVSLWAMARPGAATGGPVQLGGGQAGIRVRWPVADAGRVAVTGRIATPLAGQGREVAIGAEWRPVAPVAIVIERRIALDRGGDGTGIGVIAGIDRAISGKLAIEAYGQAGAVVRDGIEPYADGAARVSHPVATIGRSVVRIGMGGWTGAQRGAMRVDVGPSAVAVMPVGTRAVRLSVDWRQRVAGDAAPGSGPVLTLGSDF